LVFTVLKVVIGFIDEPAARSIISIVADVIAIVFIVISVPGILAGMGLYRRKEWARILSLILSVIEIFSFPFGTAIGIYSIWALTQPETIREFGSTSRMNNI
jgi:Ni,Fe-hydrogenase I cytochrome b subunit